MQTVKDYGKGIKLESLYDVVYGSLTSLGDNNTQNFLIPELTKNLYEYTDVAGWIGEDVPRGCTGLKILDPDLSKAYQVISILNDQNLTGKTIVRTKKLRDKTRGDYLGIYFLSEGRFPWEFVKKEYRHRAIDNIEECVQDYIDDYAKWEASDNEEIIIDKLHQEFPGLRGSLLKDMVAYAFDAIDLKFHYTPAVNEDTQTSPYNLEEAFKELNKKMLEAPIEATEDITEDINISSDEIKDFIAKVGVEALEKALEDVKKDPVVGMPEEEVEPDETSVEQVVDNTVVEETLNEDAASTMPAQPLNYDELYQAIKNVKNGTFLKVGYLNEIVPASKYKVDGARHKEEDPVVRILKALEVYGRIGVDWKNTKKHQDKKAVEAEANAGDAETQETPTHAPYDVEVEIVDKIVVTPLGTKCLQILPRSYGAYKVQWFISINDEDFRACDKSEVAQYCTPSSMTKVNSSELMRLNLNKIYYFKNLGHSLIR